jgi:phosphoesterase RecJ-like protein
MYSDIINRIQESESIAILSHVMPDGDNIGSSLALYNALKALGKHVKYILDDDIPNIYKFLEYADKVEKPGSNEKFDLAIVLDCSDIERLGKSASYLEGATVAVIDHHISNKKFGHLNIVDSKASATGELVYNLLNEMNCQINPKIAECLYTAIVTDTGQFQYSNTTEVTHKIIGDLITHGVIIADISKKIYQSNPKGKVLLIKKSLESLEFFNNDTITCMTLMQDHIRETGSLDSDTENLINFGRDIDSVEVAVFIKEVTKEKVKVSLRSKSKVDVCKIAAKFDGGGHLRASGCTICGSIENAKKQVINAILEQLNSGEK